MKKDRIFALAKGFRNRRKNCIRVAQPAVEKALQYAFRDRKQKKRDMRALWIQRINAASQQHGVRGGGRGGGGGGVPPLGRGVLLPLGRSRLVLAA